MVADQHLPNSNQNVVRNPQTACIHDSRRIVFRLQGKQVMFSDSDEIHAARRAWHAAREPVPYEEFQARMGPFAIEAVVRVLVDNKLLLVNSGAVLRRLLSPPRRRTFMCERLLVCMSGSIQSACFFPQLFG